MLYMFAVLDKAVNAFMPPFFCRAKGEAIRTFTDAVNDKQSPFFKHPTDFELYIVGSFDPANGTLGSASGGCERLLTAMDVVQSVA